MWQKIVGTGLLGFFLTTVGMKLWNLSRTRQISVASAAEVKLAEEEQPRLKGPDHANEVVQEFMWKYFDPDGSADKAYRIEMVGGPNGLRFLKIYPNDGTLNEFPEQEEEEDEKESY
jgi:hypothetical protein